MNTPEPGAIHLSSAIADQIVGQAQAAFPDECCGLLIGRLNGRAVTRAVAIPNAADDPQVGFIMAERALAHALMALEGTDEMLLGFYHSHPTSNPIPSPADIRAAAYPDAVQVIIGLRGQPRLAAWRIAYGQITRIELHIGTEGAAQPSSSPLQPAQVAAILISALVVTLLVLTISLSLLPPAPLIPGR